MTDIFSKDKRRKIMSKIRAKNTKPELIVRKYLFSKGYRLSLIHIYILPAFSNQRVHLFFGKRQRIAHLHKRRGIILEIGYLRTLGIQLFRSIAVSYTHLDVYKRQVYVSIVTVGSFILNV